MGRGGGGGEGEGEGGGEGGEGGGGGGVIKRRVAKCKKNGYRFHSKFS